MYNKLHHNADLLSKTALMILILFNLIHNTISIIIKKRLITKTSTIFTKKMRSKHFLRASSLC